MKLIKYLPLYILWALIAIPSSYNVLVTQKKLYDKYNGMRAIVEWSTFAPRSGIYLCGIRLQDGTYGEVNAGSYPYKVGDVYINHFRYGRIMGITGLAYCVLPDEGGMLWGLGYMLTVIGPLVVGIISLIVLAITAWIKKYEE